MNILIFSYLRSRLWRDKSCLWLDKSINVRRFFITLICLFWFGVLALRATDRYVATNGTDSGACIDWANAASNIQYAVDLATNAYDTVWVSNGSYCVTNQIMITNNITVRGLNGWTNSIVYADSAYTNTRCFYVSRTGVVNGFTITNGHYMASNNYTGGGGALLATGTIQNCYFIKNISSNGGIRAGGGGIYINNGTVSNCTFVANVAYIAGGGAVEQMGGGAILMYQSATVIGCHIASNRTDGRGGIFVHDVSSMLISNCTFNANYANESGAAFLAGGNCTMTDCVITNHSNLYYVMLNYGHMRNCVIANNTLYTVALLISIGGSATNCIIANNKSTASDAWWAGGGVSLWAAGGTLDRCIVSNNLTTAGPGGGGVFLTTIGILRNCLIHHNTNMSATGNGGGVYTYDLGGTTTGQIYNCTIVNNYSTNGGGGIAVFGANNYIVNSIIAGNNASSNTYSEIYNTGENSNNYWYCDANVTSAPLAVGQGNITNDPVFAGAGNWRLNANSPCINRGMNHDWMTNSIELDGRTRIRYGTVDIGAYEYIYNSTVYKLW